MKPQTAAKPQGILFKGPMVRAILDGCKVQTRRIVKFPDGEWEFQQETTSGTFLFYHVRDGKEEAHYFKCPYPVGTRLYCKETHSVCTDGGKVWHIRYAADDSCRPCSVGIETEWAVRKATKHAGNLLPSIFMPRWASRISLEVTGVRVQRLQEISGADAMAEGWPDQSKNVHCCDDPQCHYNNVTHADWLNVFPDSDGDSAESAREWYADLWDSINGPGAWERNDFVFAYTFRRLASLDSLAGEAE